MWRGLMLNKAVEQFLRDVHWGELDYLFIDMPPGTGDVQMGLARMLPRTDLLIVTTPAHRRPEGRRPGRRHGAAQLPAGVRRDREHVVVHVRPRQSSTPLFGDGRRPGAGRRDRRRAARPGAARTGGGGRRRRRAGRWRSTGTGLAADEFRAIARKIVDEVAPPVNMAGCSARMLSLVAARARCAPISPRRPVAACRSRRRRASTMPLIRPSASRRNLGRIARRPAEQLALPP